MIVLYKGLQFTYLHLFTYEPVYLFTCLPSRYHMQGHMLDTLGLDKLCYAWYNVCRALVLLVSSYYTFRVKLKATGKETKLGCALNLLKFRKMSDRLVHERTHCHFCIIN